MYRHKFQNYRHHYRVVDLSQIPATEKDLTLKSNSKFKVTVFSPCTL